MRSVIEIPAPFRPQCGSGRFCIRISAAVAAQQLEKQFENSRWRRPDYLETPDSLLVRGVFCAWVCLLLRRAAV